MAKAMNARLRDAPRLKDFNNHMRKAIAPEWYDFGVQLDISPDKLDVIKAGHTDPLKCCTEVFKQWCQKNENVTWKTLIEALESPSLERHDLAHNIRQSLISDADETEHQDVIVPTRNIEEFQSPALKSPPSNIPDHQSSKAEHQAAAVPTRTLEELQSAVLKSPPFSIPDCHPSTEAERNVTTSSTPNKHQDEICDQFTSPREREHDSLDNTTESIDYSTARNLPSVEAILSSLSLAKPDIQEVVTCSPKKKEKHDDKVLSGMPTSPMDIEICLPDGKVVRKYQEELATPGMEGRNCIVVAPTGTGKTLVACMIISANLKRHGLKGKVLFLVTKIPLANQQYEELKRHIKGARIMSVTGESRHTLCAVLSTHEIVVCTADLLKNDLHTGNVLLKDISLIVFDECHHCKGRTPYSFIMTEYLKKKFRGGDTRLPQIVGLTASPGAGDSRKPDLNKTVDHLIQMSALLDAEAGYITVKENITELHQYTTKTNFKRVPIPGRTDGDDFQALLIKYVNKLDIVIQRVTGKSTKQEVTDQGYFNFLATLLQESKLRPEGAENERNIRAIIEHLQHYTKILHYYFDYECEDSLLAMRNKLRSPAPDRATQVEKELQTLFTSFCQEAFQVGKTSNPKLEKLKMLLQENFGTKTTNKRAIIFVTEVENAVRMQEWILKQPELNGCIQPGVVTGHSRDTSNGMTQEVQNAIIADFRSGKFNLLVATSVLEEGIDVPACNLIIRYQHVTNEISLVQSKGRARAVDSECYAIIGKGTPKELQELQNEEKNHLVNDVIEHHLPPQSQWNLALQKFQVSTLETVEREERLEMEQKKQHRIEDVQLLCGSCSTLVCYGQDLSLEGVNYLVKCDKVKGKFNCKEYKKPYIRPTIQIQNSIHCSECDQKWGLEMCRVTKGLTYRHLCLGCDKFIFVIKGERRTFKKWKLVTFKIPRSSN